MLAAGEPALAQTPNLQAQPRLPAQPRMQILKAVPRVRPPNMPLIKPSQALRIAERLVPNSKGIDVRLLPSGNYAVRLKRNNQMQRVIIDGDTGAPR
jgi:hypothetical protein